MKKLILLVASATMLGCVTFKGVMNEWIGASKNEFVAAWGPPQEREADAGMEFYMYKYGEGGWRGSFNRYGGGFSSGPYCTISVTFSNDRVVAYRYQGSNCPKIRRN